MSNAFGPKKPLFGPYTYRVKQNVNGDTLIAVYDGNKRVAHMDAFWAYSMTGIEDHEAEEAKRGKGNRLVCATDLRSLGATGKYPNVLSVSHAFMDDDAYKGKGIGRAMYQAMMVEGFAVRESRIGGSPGPMFFIPDECKGAGNTSADAQRVWASLARQYPSNGVSIRVDEPPIIGSRPAPAAAAAPARAPLQGYSHFRNGGAVRRNYSSARRATQRISPAAQKRLEKVYKRWHWGEMPTHVIDCDPDFPPHLVEIGLLMELHLRPFGSNEDTVFAVREDDIPHSHVGFDVDHRHQRIYFQCSPALRESGRDLYTASEAQAMPLSQAADELGEGHHANPRSGYVRTNVKPLGHLTHLTYFTHKRGDGPSGYIHEMGEEGGVPPVLCVSRDGRFWLAGGTYTCPSPGITR